MLVWADETLTEARQRRPIHRALPIERSASHADNAEADLMSTVEANLVDGLHQDFPSYKKARQYGDSAVVASESWYRLIAPTHVR